MYARTSFVRAAALACAVLLAVACSSSNEGSATQAVGAVHAAIVRVGDTLAAVSPEARQRYSDELTKLAEQNDALLTRIKAGEYASVEKEAKSLLAQVDALGPQVAADKVKRDQELAADWARLETGVPAALAAAAEQVQSGSRPDQPQAQSSLAGFQDLWSQALAAQKDGNLLKAVELGLAVERGLGLLVPPGGGAGN
ncbi:MAG: hypothetical protein U1F08_09310 [Steroidobacteraceae bacterium]